MQRVLSRHISEPRKKNPIYNLGSEETGSDVSRLAFVDSDYYQSEGSDFYPALVSSNSCDRGQNNTHQTVF